MPNNTVLIDLLKSKENIEPETLRLLFPNATEEDHNRTWALILLNKGSYFWNHWFVFEKIVLALNGLVPDFNIVEGCDPEHIWFAVQTASQLHPERRYAHEVQVYAKYNCNEAGVFIYPTQLDMENPYLAEASRIAAEGPFPIGDDTPEQIQAGKLLMIDGYIDSKETTI